MNDPGLATRANVVRNARAERDRPVRWTSTRDNCWTFVLPYLDEAASVAILGAGKGHTVPLQRIAARARRLALIDVDPVSARIARRRLALRLRRRVDVVEHDVTGGLANTIVAAVSDQTEVAVAASEAAPLPGAPYDLVIGDLLYTQLLYPGLLDAGVAPDHTNQTLAKVGQKLVDLTVARIHASLTPAGTAVHLHDPIAWLPSHTQPVALHSILAAPSTDRARELLARGRLVNSGDIRAAVTLHPHAEIVTEACWQWPFTPTIDYLIWAIAAKNQTPTPDSDTADNAHAVASQRRGPRTRPLRTQ